MEPFTIKHYSEDERPTIKGNGFDGLEVGSDRQEAEEFVEFVNKLITDNKRLRHLLFMSHGSEEHYLYGDDGERHCNTCMVDFNLDDPEAIEQKFYNYNMRKIAKLQAEGKWPPEFLKAK